MEFGFKRAELYVVRGDGDDGRERSCPSVLTINFIYGRCARRNRKLYTHSSSSENGKRTVSPRLLIGYPVYTIQPVVKPVVRLVKNLINLEIWGLGQFGDLPLTRPTPRPDQSRVIALVALKKQFLFWGNRSSFGRDMGFQIFTITYNLFDNRLYRVNGAYA